MHVPKRFWTATAILAALIVVGLLLSVPHTRDVGALSSAHAPAPEPVSVSYTDSYKRGVHTFSGYVLAPDACALPSAQASLSGDGASSTIALAITLPATAGPCLELPTKAAFSASIEAPAGATVSAVTVNGAAASSTP